MFLETKKWKPAIGNYRNSINNIVPTCPLHCVGGDWIFKLNEIWGELKFLKIKGGRKRGGERGVFEIFIGEDET